MRIFIAIWTLILTSVILAFRGKLDECAKKHDDKTYKQDDNGWFVFIIVSLVLSSLYVLYEMYKIYSPHHSKVVNNATTLKNSVASELVSLTKKE